MEDWVVTKSLILLNEWKLKIVLSAKFIIGKNETFLPNRFYRVSLLRHCKKKRKMKKRNVIFICLICICKVNFIRIIVYFFLRTIKCKYMSLMELSMWQGNEHWFWCLVFICFETGPAICVPKHWCPKNWFFSISILY